MAHSGKTFSESWHRVADLSVCLRPNITVRKQYFRGRQWYVLQDPFNNEFFRLRPEAYYFVSRLRPDRTVEAVWNECMEKVPDQVPGQEDVIQMLTQLHFANLLYSRSATDSDKLFERYSKRKQRELQSKLLSIMFIRVPLFDPEQFLRQILPFTKYLVGPLGAAIWLLVVGGAAKLVFDNFDAAVNQAQGILAPGNLFLLYSGLVLVKTLHEFGHAIVCRRYGGEVHTMGVMFLIFTPLPFVDATSSWSFRSHWHRALVGAAGVLVEVFVAALMTFVWAYSGQGTMHSLAYNIMFIASVSTILFNANPLLRFDGYYILSDFLDIPNLSSRATNHLRHLAEFYLFGYKDSTSPAETKREWVWFTVFGTLSGIYRVVVFTGILFFVADKFLLAGLVMVLVCVISWGIVPLFKFTNYLATSPKLARSRLRAITVSLGLVAVVVCFLAVIPFPNRFRAPGIMEAVNHLLVVNDAAGYVDKVLVTSNTVVEPGTPLVQMSNYELDLEIESAKAQLEEAKALQTQARSQAIADLEPIQKRMDTVIKTLDELLQQRESLLVKANQHGTWVSPKSDELVGAWLPRGTQIGEIADSSSFKFSAVVVQDEAADLFVNQITQAEVRVFGQGGENIAVDEFHIIPYQQEQLPSAALGWYAGGEVAVSGKDKAGLKTVEPFFLINALLHPTPDVTFVHGRSGKLRLSLPAKPLLFQWWHLFRQLLQRRYQI